MEEKLLCQLLSESQVKRQSLARRLSKFWASWWTQWQRNSLRATCSLSDLMPSPNSGSSLREEFNRWAEAGRGEGMEQDHLPITLPMLEKMRLGPGGNVLHVGGRAGWLSSRLAHVVP